VDKAEVFGADRPPVEQRVEVDHIILKF
jgi:hypothetical protein